MTKIEAEAHFSEAVSGGGQPQSRVLTLCHMSPKVARTDFIRHEKALYLDFLSRHTWDSENWQGIKTALVKADVLKKEDWERHWNDFDWKAFEAFKAVNAYSCRLNPTRAECKITTLDQYRDYAFGYGYRDTQWFFDWWNLRQITDFAPVEMQFDFFFTKPQVFKTGRPGDFEFHVSSLRSARQRARRQQRDDEKIHPQPLKPTT